MQKIVINTSGAVAAKLQTLFINNHSDKNKTPLCVKGD